MLSVLLLGPLLLASQPDAGHQVHHAAPPRPAEADLIAKVKELATADLDYVESAAFERAQTRWNRQCKHWKKSGDLKRPIRCDRARSRLLAVIQEFSPAHPAAFRTSAQDRLAEASTLNKAAQKRASSVATTTLKSADEAQRALDNATKKAIGLRVIADEARVKARDNLNPAATAALADEASATERTAHDAEVKARQAREEALAFLVHTAAAAAKKAEEDATTAKDTDRTKLPAAAEAAAKTAEASLAEARTADAAATAAEKGADIKPADKPAAEAAAKPDEKTEAEKELDKLKAGKLIRWGITGGVAPAFYQPLHYKKDAASVPAMGALTYVLMLPGYWRSRPEQNIYCANRWSGAENEAAAARAADDLAVDRAKLIVERLLAAQKSGALKSGAATEIMCTDGRCVQDEPGVEALARKINLGGDDADAARTTLTAIVQRSTFDWTSGISASCRSRMFGMWFGYPLKYTATVPREVMTSTGVEYRRDRLEVQPIFATGLGFSPNAYVSLLAGISLGKANLPPGKDKDDELVVSFLFGLGGNLDLLGFLTK